MSDNTLKISTARTLNQAAAKMAIHRLANMGRDLPCEIVKKDKSGTILTVKFLTDNTFELPDWDVPAAVMDWHRPPYQKGDKGVVKSSSVVVSNQDGLGPKSQSPFDIPGNLSALVFHPIGNKNFSDQDDPDAHQIHGPNGTINRDTNKKSQSITHPDKGSLHQSGGDGEGNYDHESGATPDGTHTRTTKKHTTTAPDGHDVSANQTVGGDHETKGSGKVGRDHDVAGNSSTEGNHNVGGLLSAATAAIGSMSVGSMSGSGGGFSFGGGPGGNEATVGAITTTEYMTVAQLLALPLPQKFGYCLWVIDYQPAPQTMQNENGTTTLPGKAYADYLQPVQASMGGGTKMAPCFTDSATWYIG